MIHNTHNICNDILIGRQKHLVVDPLHLLISDNHEESFAGKHTNVPADTCAQKFSPPYKGLRVLLKCMNQYLKAYLRYQITINI